MVVRWRCGDSHCDGAACVDYHPAMRANGRFTALALGMLGACEPVEPQSRLEQRAGAPSEVRPGATVPTKEGEPAERPGSGADKTGKTAEHGPAGETTPNPETTPNVPPKPAHEPVTLTLGLDPDVTYRVSVVGMVQFPMADKPTGYAREETIELSDCTGEGAARRCTLTHRFSGFEAEPPAGRFLEGDFERVKHVRSSHAILGTGERPGETALEAIDAEGTPTDTPVDATIFAELSPAHRLFCIRFPDRPVSVGDTWTDTCTTVTAGTPGERAVTWSVTALEDDDDGGVRAELAYEGDYTQIAADASSLMSTDEQGDAPQQQAVRKGTVKGKLFVFVDEGQPHLMRETIVVPLGYTGVMVKTTVNVQFAREDPDDPTGRLRTDGAAFPRPPIAGP